MGRPRYPVTVCLLLAGGPLRQQPCPAGGPDHTPWPAGYGDSEEYAGQLLSTGWTQHRCPTCRLWAVWRPDQPQPQPPMLPSPTGEPWEIPDNAPSCPDCNEDPDA